MPRLNYVAIAVATVAAFILSSVWYMLLSTPLAAARQGSASVAAASPAPWKIVVEIGRSLIVAAVLAGFAARLGIVSWTSAALLGLTMWVGFPLVLWIGAIIWENVPLKLAAIHAGDWLVKLLVVAVIVGAWRR